MKKGIKVVMSGAVIAGLLAGCSIPGFGGKDNNSKNTPQTLKVLHYNEQSFYQEYGMLYSALNPEVDIEVISTNELYNTPPEDGETDERTWDEKLADFIKEKQPDVIITDNYSMPTSIEDGLFYDLTSFVSQEEYDLNGIGTTVIDYMKELGNGVIYGIPTSISSQALYYNKDVFDKYNINYPTDSMSWTDIINLANQFPTEGEYPDRVYGLKYGYYYNLVGLVEQLAASQGLRMFDADSLSMTIDTPAWRNLIEETVKLVESDVLYNENDVWQYESSNEEYLDYYSKEPLLTGKAAMVIEASYYFDELKNAKSYASKPENLTDNWDIVALPSGDGGSQQTYYGNIMTIYKDTTNLDLAWDFVSYVTGDEYARVKSFASYGNLPIRMKYATTDTDKNVQAFYATKPTSTSYYSDWDKLPVRFNNEYYMIQQEEFTKLEQGQATVEEVLATLQLKGNELLASGEMTPEELEKYYEELNASYESKYMNEDGVFIENNVSTEAEAIE